MNKINLFSLTIIVFIITLFASTCYADVSSVLVIVNPGVSQADISAKDLANIFLGKKSSWDGGGKIVAVTLKAGETHESFLKTFVKKSGSQFSTFWKQAIFTGQGIPPKEVGSEEEAVKFVSETPGAVCYISSATAHDSVKILEIK